jgi:hypothetical protein
MASTAETGRCSPQAFPARRLHVSRIPLIEAAQDGPTVARIQTLPKEWPSTPGAVSLLGTTLGVNQPVGEKRKGVSGGEDIVCVTAIEGYAGDGLVFAKHEVTATAGRAVVTVAAMPAESHALSGLEEWEVRTDGINDTGDLMTGNTRIYGNQGPLVNLCVILFVIRIPNAQPVRQPVEFCFLFLKCVEEGSELERR